MSDPGGEEGGCWMEVQRGALKFEGGRGDTGVWGGG